MWGNGDAQQFDLMYINTHHRKTDDPDQVWVQLLLKCCTEAIGCMNNNRTVSRSLTPF